MVLCDTLQSSTDEPMLPKSPPPYRRGGVAKMLDGSSTLQSAAVTLLTDVE